MLKGEKWEHFVPKSVVDHHKRDQRCKENKDCGAIGPGMTLIGNDEKFAFMILGYPASFIEDISAQLNKLFNDIDFDSINKEQTRLRR